MAQAKSALTKAKTAEEANARPVNLMSEFS
jgi:hypothetical protein